jgi:hypothetical protein
MDISFEVCTFFIFGSLCILVGNYQQESEVSDFMATGRNKIFPRSGRSGNFDFIVNGLPVYSVRGHKRIRFFSRLKKVFHVGQGYLARD